MFTVITFLSVTGLQPFGIEDTWLSRNGKSQVVTNPDILARIIHESAAPTVDMAFLPGVLGSRTLRRTVQVRLGFETLRFPGGKAIFMVSRHRFMNYPG